MSTSKLQREVSEFLSIHFGEYTIRENHRPDWLIAHDGSRLELDFYIEEIQLAIEVQGDQHFSFSSFFHGTIDNFNRKQKHDADKKNVCAQRGIRFIEICSSADIIPLLQEKRFHQEIFKPTDMAGFRNALNNLGVISDKKRKLSTMEWNIQHFKRIIENEKNSANNPQRIEKYQKRLDALLSKK